MPVAAPWTKTYSLVVGFCLTFCKGAPYSLASNKTPVVIREARKEGSKGGKEGRESRDYDRHLNAIVSSGMALDKLLFYLFE